MIRLFFNLLHFVNTSSYSLLVYILAEMYYVYSLWDPGPCWSGLSEPTVLQLWTALTWTQTL